MTSGGDAPALGMAVVARTRGLNRSGVHAKPLSSAVMPSCRDSRAIRCSSRTLIRGRTGVSRYQTKAETAPPWWPSDAADAVVEAALTLGRAAETRRTEDGPRRTGGPRGRR